MAYFYADLLSKENTWSKVGHRAVGLDPHGVLNAMTNDSKGKRWPVSALLMEVWKLLITHYISIQIAPQIIFSGTFKLLSCSVLYLAATIYVANVWEKFSTI